MGKATLRQLPFDGLHKLASPPGSSRSAARPLRSRHVAQGWGRRKEPARFKHDSRFLVDIVSRPVQVAAIRQTKGEGRELCKRGSNYISPTGPTMAQNAVGGTDQCADW